MNSRGPEVPTDEAGLQNHLVEKGLTAPRVTPEMIDAEIVSEHYFTAGDGVDYNLDRPGGPFNPMGVPPSSMVALDLITFCVLVLKNGFTVTGESACASPANFDEAVGRAIAKRNARDKIWALLGFRLRDQLSKDA